MAETKYPPNPLPCGCGAVGVMDLESFETTVRYKNIHVRFCPLHRAAGELLKALNDLVEALPYTSDQSARLRLSVEKARAVIAKASGEAG